MTRLQYCRLFLVLISFTLVVLSLWIFPEFVTARNISQYRDLISDSAPAVVSNHTLSFQIKTPVGPGGYIELVPPDGFETLSTSTFSALRNVELSVNGFARTVGPVLSASDDYVEIFPGSPGMIRYTLNQSSGLNQGDMIEIKIGNHTGLANQLSVTFSTTTGTTTTAADVMPILNSTELGTHEFDLSVYDGVEVARAGFLIALVDTVGVGPVDTTEEIPPFRFNGAPTGTLSGTTLNVELSLETDEFAQCRYSAASGTVFSAIPNIFGNTGALFHTQVVAVTPNSVNTFYIRCIDDEGNSNSDDYEIIFSVNATPTGTPNTDGDVDGDGTGTGNDGGGSGSGGGGTSGSSDGGAPTTGNTSGGGGSGGGGGGGSGGGSGNNAGGGFENFDAPYRSGDGQVVITGYAPARSKVVVLVDGKIAEETTASVQGSYSVTITAISRGVYTFGVYAIDLVGIKTSTFSTSFTVSGARESALSNINIPPSLKVTPDPVTPGQSLTLSGYTIPNAVVTVENEKEGSSPSRKSYTATAGSNGNWTLQIETASFSNGTYKTRARAVGTGTIATNFSNYILYGVGQAANRPLTTDLNTDRKVNLVDFSILLFWWGTVGGDSNPPADINSDKKVNLTDFSILLFNWTG